jgi:cold shock CspA family protein
MTMNQPLRIEFTGTELSEALTGWAREKALALERLRPDMRCRRVAVASDQRLHEGRRWTVHVDASCGGRELTVQRSAVENPRLALRDAFDAIARQVEDTVPRVRAACRQQERPSQGEIRRIDAERRYGFIRGADGEEYCFGPYDVIGVAFEELRIGEAVLFIGEPAGEGRQARCVSTSHHALA